MTNYNFPIPTVTYFQLTILHLPLSIPWSHPPYPSHQFIPSNSHCYIFPTKNSIFRSQNPLTTQITSAISIYILPSHIFTYLQLTILHLKFSVPWPSTLHLPYLFIASQTPTVSCFQITFLLLNLSIPWPHTPHLPYQIITSQVTLVHISINYSIFASQCPLTWHPTCAIINFNLATHIVTYFQLSILI
jgi:uncharacterized protein YhhL (DUF1145 family)